MAQIKIEAIEILVVAHISDFDAGVAANAAVAANTAKNSFPGFSTLLSDYGFTDDSANWDTAFGWGDHASGGYEDALGNPATSGFVLSSTDAGVRSWVAQSGVTNSGDADEFVKSDGTNLVGTKVFSSASGNLTLGDTGLTGGDRIIKIEGSLSNVGLNIDLKGNSNLAIQKDGSDRFEFTYNGFFHFPDTLSGTGSKTGAASMYFNQGDIEIVNGDVSSAGVVIDIGSSGGTTIRPKGSAANITLLTGGTGKTASVLGDNVQIGGATDKIGFYNTTPVIQALSMTTQLTTITHTAPGTPDYALQDMTNSSPYGFVTQDEANTLLSVVENLQVRVQELEDMLDATSGIGIVA